MLALMPGFAAAQCAILSDTGLYQERLQQSILLMQYRDTIVRATDGKIRCNEDAGNARQTCMIEGAGEMLMDTGEQTLVVRLSGSGMHEVHLSASGDVTCIR